MRRFATPVNTLCMVEAMVERLSRERWIAEGLVVLASEGAEALVGERMAKRLGVSRGSFYWHFTNAEDFQGAVLGAWEERWTSRIVTAAQADRRTPRERLHSLIQQTGGQDAHVYAAAKRLARKQAGLTDQIKRIDDARIGLVADILRSAGLSDAEALMRARVIYEWAIGRMVVSGDEGSVSPLTAEALTRFAFAEA